jgi:PAS domain S-box-containing protein
MTQTLRILLIDDNRSDRTLVIRELQRAFAPLEVQEIISSVDFNQAIRTDNFDAVVTDFQLRWTTGLEILEIVKQHYPHCPVIMFTNTGTEEIAVEAMKLGLDDYIIKEPNRYIRVPASVQIALERRKAQQRVALLEIRLQGLLNQVRVGIFRSQPDGTLLEVNPAFLALFGVASLAQVNDLNLLNTHNCYVQLSELPPPQRLEQEVQLYRQDGTSFWALLTATLNTVEGITVVDGLLEDITARKQSEMTLQQVNATLEARVQERTAELEATNQVLEAFAYSVSHDLRAPLRAIQGFARILLEDLSESLAANHLVYLQRIAVNAQKLDTLIKDLLAYSRLKQAELALEPVNLSPVITEALTQLEADIQARQAQIQVDEPLPIVQANHLILVQVLTNLLSNAIKFVAPNEPPQVRVWAEVVGKVGEDREVGEVFSSSSPSPASPSSQAIRLWVEDNGIGIAPEKQQEIFQPFVCLHGEETYPGTGIGLAIAQKGIERMGGQIGVESQLGQGSRFWVELPTVEGR